jgi:hypothetical protein
MDERASRAMRVVFRNTRTFSGEDELWVNHLSGTLTLGDLMLVVDGSTVAGRYSWHYIIRKGGRPKRRPVPAPILETLLHLTLRSRLASFFWELLTGPGLKPQEMRDRVRTVLDTIHGNSDLICWFDRRRAGNRAQEIPLLPADLRDQIIARALCEPLEQGGPPFLCSQLGRLFTPEVTAALYQEFTRNISSGSLIYTQDPIMTQAPKIYASMDELTSALERGLETLGRGAFVAARPEEVRPKRTRR